MYRAFLQLDLLSSRASVLRALMHKFPGINTYLPQNRHLPALKPYLLGRDNVFNAVWQTQIRYNSRQGVSPANCAVVPKKTHVPVSVHSTPQQCPWSSMPHLHLLSTADPQSFLLLCQARRHHRLHGLGPLTQAGTQLVQINLSLPALSSHVPHTPHSPPGTETLTRARELTAISCQTPCQP